MTERSPIVSRSAQAVFKAAVLAVGGIALLIVFVVNGPRQGGGHFATQAPGVGRQLVGLALEPLTGNGSQLKLADLEGKVVLLNFWGPWCMYCRVEMPHLAKLHDQLRHRPDFQFVSVSCSSGSERLEADQLRAESAEYLTQNHLEFAVYWDPAARSRQAFENATQVQGFRMGYPTTVVLDRAGVIRGIWHGYADSNSREMSQLINELFGTAGKI
jgi:thiol-disulfide isomerase/thioredoxin